MTHVLRMGILGVLLIGFVLLVTGSQAQTAEADEVLARPAHFYAVATGDQEVPPTGSAGYAVAAFSVNAQRNELRWAILEVGVANITASHIHRAPRGVNGPIIYNIGAFDGFNTGSIAFTRSDLSDFKTGGVYYNVHTMAFPGGEVRGQLKNARP